MYIPYDCDGGADMHNIAFPHQNLLGLFTNLPQQCLSEQLFLKSLLDALIEVEWGHPKRPAELLNVGAANLVDGPVGRYSHL